MPQENEVGNEKLLIAVSKVVKTPSCVFEAEAAGWGVALHILTKLCVKADVSVSFHYETGWKSEWTGSEWDDPSRDEDDQGYAMEVANMGSLTFAQPAMAVFAGYAMLKEYLEEQCETD